MGPVLAGPGGGRDGNCGRLSLGIRGEEAPMAHVSLSITTRVGGGTLATPTLHMYPFFRYAIQVNVVQATENIEATIDTARRVLRFTSKNPDGSLQMQDESSGSGEIAGGVSVEKLKG